MSTLKRSISRPPRKPRRDGDLASKGGISLKRKAYEHIRAKLLSGQLPAGAAISELALAQEIGISRTPVREAIGRLVAERLGSGRARLDDTEMQRFLAADMKFHMLLLRAAGNLRIMKVVADTRLLTRIFSFRREGHDAGRRILIARE